MLFLAPRIEPPLDVSVQRSHHTDPGHHCRAVLFGDQDQAFHRCLPFRCFVFSLWQLGDVGSGVLQGDELPAVRQHNRIVEATLPGQSSTPPVWTGIQNIGAVRRFDQRLGRSGSGTPISSLLIRRHIADGDLAFFTTWCPAGTSIETLVAVEGHRWAIEDSFETARNEFGLDHNESRSWHGWHRHVSLVMLAFAMMAVIRHRANSPPPKKKKRRTTAKLKISPIRH
jgi:hypothetical protein